MKVVHKTIAALALVSMVGVAAYAARPIANAMPKVTADGGKVTPAPAAAAPFNYFTGFEAGPISINPGTGFNARVPGWVQPALHADPIPPGSGHIVDQPCAVGPYCWGTTTAANRSLWEAHVDVVNPFGGSAQHLRMSYDQTTRTNQAAFGVGVDARLPINADIQPVPNAPNTYSMEIAITNTFGMDYTIQPQHIAAGFRLTQTLFHYYGGLYTIDNACGTVAAVYMPFGLDGSQIGWDTTGAYHNLTEGWDTCTGDLLFYVDGVRMFPACVLDINDAVVKCFGGPDNGNPCSFNTDCRATCMWTPGTSIDQILMYGDNFSGSSMDVDDMTVTMDAVGITTCGDNFISYGCSEQCEMGPGEDANCPGRCVDCTCTPICTFDDPCPLSNGANGPYLTSSGFYTYTPSSPFISIDDCGSVTRSGGVWDSSIYIVDAGGGYVGYNDNCNGGTFGAGADPSAPCFDGVAPFDNAYQSCLCVDGTLGALLIEVDEFGGPPAAGNSSIINVNKKAVCGDAHLGSCCDTNGHDGDPSGCEDNVPASACGGPFDTWSAVEKCPTIPAGVGFCGEGCIPDCDGRECGDDGCGGICLPNDCDDSNPCTDDSCDTAGQCHNDNNTIACDDGLFCTTPDFCAGGICSGPPRVCSNSNVCDGVETCDEDLDICTNPDDLVCDDGLFCNGSEGCDPIDGCFDNEDPCDETQTCYEYKDHCYDNIIPTVSEWGLVILTLLLLTGAKVYFSRRQATA